MTDPVDGLLQDVTAMTRQAAIDGLSLGSVYADVRLVLDLEAEAELPAEVLRACAVAWSRTHQDLDGDGPAGVLTWGDLEDRLWGSTVGPGAELPTWAALVEAGAPRGEAGPTWLPADDRLRGVAEVLASRLERSTEHVAMIPRSGPASAGVVALIQGDALRAEQVREWVSALAPDGSGLEVTLHRLSDHPDGFLAALRQVAARVARGD